jgi:2-dehydropantoate 2-reductase
MTTAKTTMIPFHIIGSGSIGLLWAASIRSALTSYPLTVLLRSHHQPRLMKLSRNDYTKKDVENGEVTLHRTDASSSPEIVVSPQTQHYVPSQDPSPQQQQQQQQQHHHHQQFIRVAVSQHYHGSHNKATNNDNNDSNDNRQNSKSLLAHIPAQLILPWRTSDTALESQQPTNIKSNYHPTRKSPNQVIQNLMVATKAYQAVEAVESVLERLLSVKEDEEDDDTTETGEGSSVAATATTSSNATRNIILLCNGALSVQEKLEKVIQKKRQELSQQYPQRQLPRTNLVLATTTHGAYPQPQQPPPLLPDLDSSTYHIVHAGFGKTFVDDTMPVGLAHVWMEPGCGLNTTMVSRAEMKLVLWQKLAANCVINPLTALLNCPNGELLMEPNMPEIAHQVVDEISQVANLVVAAAAAAEMINDAEKEEEDNGQEKNNHHPQPQQQQQPSSHPPHHALSRPALLQFVYQVIQDTMYNQSSMLQDVRNQQRTEIDHLNGYIVQKGKSLGVDCPANDDLWHRILELTARQNRNKNNKT